MVVGFKYKNGILEILPNKTAPFFKVSNVSEIQLKIISGQETIELDTGVYGVGYDRGDDTLRPKATNALGIIWDDHEDLYSDLTPALDILSYFPFAMKAGAGENLRKFAKILQRKIFETRLQQLGLADTRKKLATPKFGYANYIILNSKPERIEAEEVEAQKETDAIYQKELTFITEDPVWPSHFRYLQKTDDIFIPENWIANYKPVHITVGGGINRDLEMGFVMNADLRRIHLITLSPLHVLKTWEFENELRGFDIDDEYIYTLEEDNEQIKFRVYNWELEKVKEYTLGDYNLYGLCVMFNTLVTYDASSDEYGIFEARYAFAKFENKATKIFDAFTKITTFINGVRNQIIAQPYVKKHWQPIDEYLWLRGYKRGDTESPGLQYQMQYLFQKHRNNLEKFLEKVFQGNLTKAVLSSLTPATLETYAIGTTFEKAKWGDIIYPSDGEIWKAPATDETLINTPLQVLEYNKENDKYQIVITNSGKRTLDDPIQSFQDVYKAPIGYIYNRTDKSLSDTITPPIKFLDRYIYVYFNAIKCNIPADEIIVSYEDGTEIHFKSSDFTVENGQITIAVNLERYFDNGKLQKIRFYQKQGDELIELFPVYSNIGLSAIEKQNYVFFEPVDLEQYELKANEITKPVVGNAKIIVDDGIIPNSLETSIERSFEDTIKITQLAYHKYDDNYPEPKIYTKNTYNITVKLQKPVIQDDRFTYVEDSVIAEKSITAAGRIVATFSIGVGKTIEPSQTLLDIPTSPVTLSGDIPWFLIKFIRTINSKTVLFEKAETFLNQKGELVLRTQDIETLTDANAKIWVPNSFKIIISISENTTLKKTFYINAVPEIPQELKFEPANIKIAGS